MNKLEKQDGVYYTQNIDNLPIEERVFFREGKGVSATSENYRVATQQELQAWEEYKNKNEEQFILYFDPIFNEIPFNIGDKLTVKSSESFIIRYGVDND